MMRLGHVAIWTANLEQLKTYYSELFHGVAGPKYSNRAKQFQSYFLEFPGGSRLEIMTSPAIPSNRNDTIDQQHLGLIHIAFELDTREQVDRKWRELRDRGFQILDGPRVTGDGYYEFTTLDPDNNRIEVTTKVG
jgi:lactoylglutathione lyase